MSTQKNTNRHLTLAQIEASYGAQTAAIAATDTSYTIHTFERPTVTPAWQFDGATAGLASPGGSTYPNVAPFGRKATFALPMYFRKQTVPYSASVIPEVAKVARGHGYAATFNATGSAALGPLWMLAPQREGFSSLAVDFYQHGEFEHVWGAYLSSLTIEAEGVEVPRWTFEGQGMAATDDIAIPSVGFVATNRRLDRAVAVSSSVPVLSLTSSTGSQVVSLKTRSFRFRSERTLEERISGMDATYHAGFAMGNDEVTLECVVEAVDRTTTTSSPYMDGAADKLHPTKLYEAADTFAATLTVGSLGFSIAGATVNFTAEPQRDASGAIATWGLSMRFNPSAEHFADSHTIKFPYN